MSSATPTTGTYHVAPEHAGATLAAWLRGQCEDLSWNKARALVASRRVRLNGEIWLDPARRLQAADTIELLDQPASRASVPATVTVLHLDRHFVVVDKPAGMRTVRHRTEHRWSARRKQLVPAAEDVARDAIVELLNWRDGQLPRLRVVHRIDKPTSGLLVFARTELAQQRLVEQFAARTVGRRYLAIVAGHLAAQRVVSPLVRDRGDGVRGGGREGTGQEAITNVEPVERLGGHSLVACQLETGRTHQIRIHLAELGHPVCGDAMYRRRADGLEIADTSGAARLALHATELAFNHPVSGDRLSWTLPLPGDLEPFLKQLRRPDGSP